MNLYYTRESSSVLFLVNSPSSMRNANAKFHACLPSVNIVATQENPQFKGSDLCFCKPHQSVGNPRQSLSVSKRQNGP